MPEETLSEKRRRAAMARKTKSGGTNGGRPPGPGVRGKPRITCECGKCRTCYHREYARKRRAQ